MLSVERLRALCEVAEHGSVAAAARSMYLTPSGVSQQLGKLEREVGVRLLEPAGRGVRLTDAGRLLARRGEGILSALRSAESDVALLHGQVLGDLRFGAFLTASRAVMPRAIRLLADRYPDLSVTLAEGESENTLLRVLRRDLDVAVVDSWATLPLAIPAEVTAVRLYRDVADVALPYGHPAASSRVVDLRDLADTPWAAWTTGTGFHDWLVQTMRAQGVEPKVRYEVAEFAAQLEFVADGLAAALIPRLAREHVPANVRLVPTEPELHRDVYAAWRTDSERPSVRAGVDALRQAFSAVTAPAT